MMKKPVISMRTLGKNGRFGNQVFQYAFLKIYGKEHSLDVETPEWIGQYLFGHSDPPIFQELTQVKEGDFNLAEALIPKSETPFQNVDFWGYFQYHTKYYAPYRDYFLSLFKPVPEIEAEMNRALYRLRSIGRTVIGLHLRRGDFGVGPFFVAPNEWYKDWLETEWDKFDKPVLFIASDEPGKVITDFAGYKPVTAGDLGAVLPAAEFYPDFYLLSQCDILAISNSSYSFAACMLNENCRLFLRPHLLMKKLITFDPWNSAVLFFDEDIANLIKRIGGHLTSEKLEEAQIDIEYGLEKFPDHPDLLNLRGELRLHKGEIEEAKEIFSDIVKRRPDHIQALNNLAVVMYYEKNYDMAIDVLEGVLRLDPLCKEAAANLEFIREARTT